MRHQEKAAVHTMDRTRSGDPQGADCSIIAVCSRHFTKALSKNGLIGNIGAALATIVGWALWKGPAAFWRHLWPLCTFFRAYWLPYAPWGFLAVAAFAWIELRDLAERSTTAPSADAWDSMPFAIGPQEIAQKLVQRIQSITQTTSPMAWLGWSAFGALWAAFLGTGPIHTWRFSRGGRGTYRSHGSARWGTAQEAIEHGLIAPKSTGTGIMLGRVTLPRHNKEELDDRLRIKRHLVTCAATRSGKGIGGAIPNLLEYPGSTFSLDIKGELYAVTAAARMEKDFEIARLDPFNVDEKATHRFNWLDGIQVDSDNCVAESLKLADAIVLRQGGADSHWDDQAAFLLQGLILHVATLAQSERHMGTVRHLLTLSADDLTEELKAMQKQPRGCGVIAKMANAFLGKDVRERSGILSTAQRHTGFLDDPRIIEALRVSDFSLADLKEKKLSVYVMMPADSISSYSRFIRATLAMALGAMTQKQAQPEHPVLFLIDEFPQLGHLTAVENAMPILQGYGALIWLFVQDLSQLRVVYRKWESFLGNAAWQVFGVQDQGTARYVSEALGHQTVRLETTGTSTNTGARHEGRGHSTSEAFIGRPLLTADEVRQLPRDQVIVIQGGERPMLLERLNYLTDPETQGSANANPLYAVLETKKRP